MYDPRDILKRSIEGKHAVHDVADVVGHPKEAENAETLMDSLQHNPRGDLVLAPDDFWSVEDSLAEIRSFRDSEDE